MNNPSLKILFFDSDIKVLQGLQRRFRPMQFQWEQHFVSSAKEAFSKLSSKPFDFIFCEIRLRDIDGIQFLKQVKKTYPEVVRVILSAETDQEMLMKSTRVAHQFLAKPCAAEAIADLIRRSSKLRTVIHSGAVKKIISSIDCLPSLPAIYSDLMDTIESPVSSIKDFGKIISRDPSMSAKILQLVNSSFFGLAKRVSCPSDAVGFLGLETIKALVLSEHIFNQFCSEAIPVSRMISLWDHSQAVGLAARSLAKTFSGNRQMLENCFTAGLLHDCGKLILMFYFFEDYQRVIKRSENESRLSVHDVEKTIFGVTHAETGAYLVSLWGLQDSIVEALAFHHRPLENLNGTFNELSAVHTADLLVHKCLNNSVDDLSVQLLKAGGIDSDTEALAEKIRQGLCIGVQEEKTKEKGEF